MLILKELTSYLVHLLFILILVLIIQRTSFAQNFPLTQEFKDFVTADYPSLRNKTLKIAFFSPYDYCESNGISAGDALTLKKILQSVFGIESVLVPYSNSNSAELALLNGEADIVFGLRKTIKNKDSNITFSGKVFLRDFYIISNDIKKINIRSLNVSALTGQDLVSFPNTDVANVFDIFLNIPLNVKEIENATEIIDTLNSDNGKNYGVIPGDRLPEVLELTKNIVLARFISDSTGRIATLNPELAPLIQLINEYVKNIGPAAFESIQNVDRINRSRCLFRVLPGITESEKDFLDNIKTLEVVITEIRYPIVFLDDDNKADGIYIDELKRFADIIGVPIEFKYDYSVDELSKIQNSLKENQVLVNYFQFRKFRHDNISSVTNYFFDKLVVYARKSTEENWRHSKKIGIVESSPAQRYLLRTGLTDLKAFEFGSTLFPALKDGTVDYALAVDMSYLEQIFRDDYWMIKVDTLPIILTLDTFIYNKSSPIGSLFERAMNVHIDYNKINSNWRDNSDRIIAIFMSKYYANLNEQNRKQVILIAVIGFLALAAVSMFLLLRARTTTNNALLLATKSAKEASAAKSMFLSNMSHEIRTPLNAILGLSQIAKYSNNQSRALEVIGQIESAGNHLLALINDILDMSKIEASSFVISNVPFNVLKCIDNISEMIKIKANEKSLNFITSIDKKMPKYLIGDSLRLDQVLLNLLSNAIKFTPKDGTVSLTAKVIEDDDKSVLISFEVLDTGIGIIQENIQKIFLPFEQADGSITKSFGGTGLGLSISKKLAELMNGEIIVDSEQGKGSIFTLTARFNKPLEEPIEEEFTPIKEFVSNNIITKILLVDDMPINRLIVRKMLEKEAVSIEEATDGLEAVNKFTASPVGYYDIILMDVHMPKMNGYEATRNIRAQERIDAEEVCIIAMTASAFSEDVALAKESGMNDHMSKPINMKMLISKIEVYRKKHYIG